MMQLSATVLGEISRTITRPGALVEIGFSVPLRLSTRGARSWAGSVWSEMDYNRSNATAAIVGTFEYTGDIVMNGSVRVNTINRAFAQRCKFENVVGKSLRIWSLYTTNPYPEADEPVLEFDGFVSGAQLGDKQWVELAIATEDLYSMYSPREFYNEVGGYTCCAPEDKIVTFGQQDYRFSEGT